MRDGVGSVARSVTARCCNERRRGTIAVAVGIGIVARSFIEGIGDAGEISAGCRCHALTVAVERAVAEAGIFIALKAERMAGPDGVRRPCCK